jgi:hypothetical protein
VRPRGRREDGVGEILDGLGQLQVGPLEPLVGCGPN